MTVISLAQEDPVLKKIQDLEANLANLNTQFHCEAGSTCDDKKLIDLQKKIESDYKKLVEIGGDFDFDPEKHKKKLDKAIQSAEFAFGGDALTSAMFDRHLDDFELSKKEFERYRALGKTSDKQALESQAMVDMATKAATIITKFASFTNPKIQKQVQNALKVLKVLADPYASQIKNPFYLEHGIQETIEQVAKILRMNNSRYSNEGKVLHALEQPTSYAAISAVKRQLVDDLGNMTMIGSDGGQVLKADNKASQIYLLRLVPLLVELARTEDWERAYLKNSRDDSARSYAIQFLGVLPSLVTPANGFEKGMRSEMIAPVTSAILDVSHGLSDQEIVPTGLPGTKSALSRSEVQSLSTLLKGQGADRKIIETVESGSTIEDFFISYADKEGLTPDQMSAIKRLVQANIPFYRESKRSLAVVSADVRQNLVDLTIKSILKGYTVEQEEVKAKNKLGVEVTRSKLIITDQFGKLVESVLLDDPDGSTPSESVQYHFLAVTTKQLLDGIPGFHLFSEDKKLKLIKDFTYGIGSTVESLKKVNDIKATDQEMLASYQKGEHLRDETFDLAAEYKPMFNASENEAREVVNYAVEEVKEEKQIASLLVLEIPPPDTNYQYTVDYQTYAGMAKADEYLGNLKSELVLLKTLLEKDPKTANDYKKIMELKGRGIDRFSAINLNAKIANILRPFWGDFYSLTKNGALYRGQSFDDWPRDQYLLSIVDEMIRELDATKQTLSAHINSDKNEVYLEKDGDYLAHTQALITQLKVPDEQVKPIQLTAALDSLMRTVPGSEEKNSKTDPAFFEVLNTAVVHQNPKVSEWSVKNIIERRFLSKEDKNQLLVRFLQSRSVDSIMGTIKDFCGNKCFQPTGERGFRQGVSRGRADSPLFTAFDYLLKNANSEDSKLAAKLNNFVNVMMAANSRQVNEIAAKCNNPISNKDRQPCTCSGVAEKITSLAKRLVSKFNPVLVPTHTLINFAYNDCKDVKKAEDDKRFNCSTKKGDPLISLLRPYQAMLPSGLCGGNPSKASQNVLKIPQYAMPTDPSPNGLAPFHAYRKGRIDCKNIKEPKSPSKKIYEACEPSQICNIQYMGVDQKYLCAEAESSLDVLEFWSKTNPKSSLQNEIKLAKGRFLEALRAKYQERFLQNILSLAPYLTDKQIDDAIKALKNASKCLPYHARKAFDQGIEKLSRDKNELDNIKDPKERKRIAEENEKNRLAAIEKNFHEHILGGFDPNDESTFLTKDSPFYKDLKQAVGSSLIYEDISVANSDIQRFSSENRVLNQHYISQYKFTGHADAAKNRAELQRIAKIEDPNTEYDFTFTGQSPEQIKQTITSLKRMKINHKESANLIQHAIQAAKLSLDEAYLDKINKKYGYLTDIPPGTPNRNSLKKGDDMYISGNRRGDPGGPLLDFPRNLLSMMTEAIEKHGGDITKVKANGYEKAWQLDLPIDRPATYDEGSYIGYDENRTKKWHANYEDTLFGLGERMKRRLHGAINSMKRADCDHYQDLTQEYKVEGEIKKAFEGTGFITEGIADGVAGTYNFLFTSAKEMDEYNQRDYFRATTGMLVANQELVNSVMAEGGLQQWNLVYCYYLNEIQGKEKAGSWPWLTAAATFTNIGLIILPTIAAGIATAPAGGFGAAIVGGVLGTAQAGYEILKAQQELAEAIQKETEQRDNFFGGAFGADVRELLAAVGNSDNAADALNTAYWMAAGEVILNVAGLGAAKYAGTTIKNAELLAQARKAGKFKGLDKAGREALRQSIKQQAARQANWLALTKEGLRVGGLEALKIHKYPGLLKDGVVGAAKLLYKPVDIGVKLYQTRKLQKSLEEAASQILLHIPKSKGGYTIRPLRFPKTTAEYFRYYNSIAKIDPYAARTIKVMFGLRAQLPKLLDKGAEGKLVFDYLIDQLKGKRGGDISSGFSVMISEGRLGNPHGFKQIDALLDSFLNCLKSAIGCEDMLAEYLIKGKRFNELRQFSNRNSVGTGAFANNDSFVARALNAELPDDSTVVQTLSTKIKEMNDIWLTKYEADQINNMGEALLKDRVNSLLLNDERFKDVSLLAVRTDPDSGARAFVPLSREELVDFIKTGKVPKNTEVLGYRDYKVSEIVLVGGNNQQRRGLVSAAFNDEFIAELTVRLRKLDYLDSIKAEPKDLFSVSTGQSVNEAHYARRMVEKLKKNGMETPLTVGFDDVIAGKTIRQHFIDTGIELQQMQRNFLNLEKFEPLRRSKLILPTGAFGDGAIDAIRKMPKDQLRKELEEIYKIKLDQKTVDLLVDYAENAEVLSAPNLKGYSESISIMRGKSGKGIITAHDVSGLGGMNINAILEKMAGLDLTGDPKSVSKLLMRAAQDARDYVDQKLLYFKSYVAWVDNTVYKSPHIPDEIYEKTAFTNMSGDDAYSFQMDPEQAWRLKEYKKKFPEVEIPKDTEAYKRFLAGKGEYNEALYGKEGNWTFFRKNHGNLKKGEGPFITREIAGEQVQKQPFDWYQYDLKKLREKEARLVGGNPLVGKRDRAAQLGTRYLTSGEPIPKRYLIENESLINDTAKAARKKLRKVMPELDEMHVRMDYIMDSADGAGTIEVRISGPGISDSGSTGGAYGDKIKKIKEMLVSPGGILENTFGEKAKLLKVEIDFLEPIQRADAPVFQPRGSYYFIREEETPFSLPFSFSDFILPECIQRSEYIPLRCTG